MSQEYYNAFFSSQENGVSEFLFFGSIMIDGTIFYIDQRVHVNAFIDYKYWYKMQLTRLIISTLQAKSANIRVWDIIIASIYGTLRSN